MSPLDVRERANSMGGWQSKVNRRKSLNRNKEQTITPKITEGPQPKSPFNPPILRKEKRRDIISLLEKESKERLGHHKEIYKDEMPMQRRKHSERPETRTSRIPKGQTITTILTKYQKQLEKIAQLKKVTLQVIVRRVKQSWLS